MTPTLSDVWLVIPASGVGSRMASTTPKQYLTIEGISILEHTVACFQDIDAIAGILIVISQYDQYFASIEKRLAPQLNAKTRLEITLGGKERADSVLNGLSYLKNTLGLDDEQWVMVHDAARPCVKPQDILKLLELQDTDWVGGILATPVKDTMKRACQGTQAILHTESRENLWHALTPQLFRLAPLLNALRQGLERGEPITDEASVMELGGKSVALVEGTADNIKLTSPSDLPFLEFLLNRRGKNNNV